MSNSRTFIIPGKPIPWKRAGYANGTFYCQQKHSKLNTGIYIHNQHNGELFTGPLALDITFYFPMPLTQKKKWDELRLKHHCFRPDLDNLLKYYLDIFSGLLFEDYCSIAQINARKLYDDVSRTEFTLTEIKS